MVGEAASVFDGSSHDVSLEMMFHQYLSAPSPTCLHFGGGGGGAVAFGGGGGGRRVLDSFELSSASAEAALSGEGLDLVSLRSVGGSTNTTSPVDLCCHKGRQFGKVTIVQSLLELLVSIAGGGGCWLRLRLDAFGGGVVLRRRLRLQLFWSQRLRRRRLETLEA